MRDLAEDQKVSPVRNEALQVAPQEPGEHDVRKHRALHLQQAAEARSAHGWAYFWFRFSEEFRSLSSLIYLGFQNADIRQVSVVLCVIEAIADDEVVRAVKADIGALNVRLPRIVLA